MASQTLRDFLLGAQQFQSGAGQFADTATKMRQQAAQDELAAQMPDLLSQLRTGTPEEQARAAGSYNAKLIQAGHKDQFGDQIARYALPDTSKSKSPYDIEAVRSLLKGDTQEEQYKFANLPRDSQDAILKQKADLFKQDRTDTRQSKSQGFQTSEKEKTAAQDFGSKYTAYSKEFDKGLEGIKAQLEAFKGAPSQVEAVNLAIAIGKAAGLSGSTSENEVDRQTFKTLDTQAQKLANFWQSNPGASLDAESIAAYEKLANSVIKASQEKRNSILRGYVSSQVPAYSDRLFKGDDKHAVLKQIEKDLGVSFKKSENGIEMTKDKTTHTGGVKDLISAAENIKDPASKQKWIGYLNKNPNLTEEQVNYLSDKIKKESSQ